MRSGVIYIIPLFLGTDADNVADMDSKGRRKTVVTSGERHPLAKLTATKVRKIRASGERDAVLARVYNVSPATIARVRKRQAWLHVE